MNKNLAKRMVAAAILTSWLATPGIVFAQGRVELSGNNPETQPGISDSHYSGNYGGAVYNSGTNKTLSGEFSNNSSQVSGGAIFNEKNGAINVTNGSKFVNNTIITTDTPQSFGGAIYNNGSLIFEGGTKENHTIFSGNTSVVGGAIYNATTGDPLHFGDYTEFSNNTATGALKADGKGITGTGGAIHARSGFTAGDNLLFSNNQTGQNSYGGGAISIDLTNTVSMPDPVKMGSVTIGKNAHFIGNHTDVTVNGSRGGAILVEAAPQGVTLGEGAYFENNRAQAGGAIYTQAEITLKDGATFKGNEATNNAFGLISGGAISNWFGTVNLGQNTQFLSNKSAGNGGAIDNFGTLKIGNVVDGVLKADNDLFDGNHSDKNGGAINNWNKVEIGSGAGFTNNSANGNGGAIANSSVTLPFGGGADGKSPMTLNGDITIGDNAYFGQVTLNSANEIIGTKNGNSAVVQGGAIANMGAGSKVTIGNKALFAGNKAGQGGAISNYDGTVKLGNDAIFVGNSANTAGAISNVSTAGNKASIEIGDNALFMNNTANDYAGAILSQNSNLKIGNKARFISNKNGQGGEKHSGGAIAMDSNAANDTPSFGIIGNEVLFSGNEATKSGGGLYIYEGGGELSFDIGEKAVFYDNKAGVNGGAVAVFGASGTTQSGFEGLVIGKDAIFDKNSAGEKGGAIYISDFGGHDASLTIKGGSNFTNNTAGLQGGAIYNAGNITLDTTDGDIIFNKNTAAGKANDIYMAKGSSLEIKGGKTVFVNGGIAGEKGDAGDKTIITNSGSNLNLNGDNKDYQGDFSQTSGNTYVSKNFFGGESTISGGSLDLGNGAVIVEGSTVNITGTGNASIGHDANVTVNGTLIGDSTIENFGNLEINGNQSGFTGTYTQSAGKTIVNDGAKFFGGTNNIDKGTLVLKKGALLSNSVLINDYGVAIDLDGRKFILSTDGIEINDGNFVKGKLNLENTKVEVSEDKGVTTDIYVANGSTITNTGGTINDPVKVTNNSKLSFGAGAVTGNEQKFELESGSTVNLTPIEGSGTLNLNGSITGGAGTNVTVEGTEVTVGPDKVKYNVGNIVLASTSDNSGFTGNFTQKDGVLTVDKGAVFFGGNNEIVTDNVDKTSGTLVLNDGALLSNDVKITGNDNVAVDGLAKVAFKGSTGEITQADITSGNFNYAAIDGASGNTVSVDKAGVLFANDTIIKDLHPTDNALVLDKNNGVRLIGFADNSGVEGDIKLGDSTGLMYADNAYIKDDSKLTMENADLIFANDSTAIDYNPVIEGSGKISMIGGGLTNVKSTLNSDIDIFAEDGVLSLSNKNTTEIGKIDVETGTDEKAPTVIVNVAADKTTVKDLNVTGKNATLILQGDVTGENAVVNQGTLGVLGNSSLTGLSLGSTLNMLGNNRVNNLDINGDFTLTDNSNLAFDVDPRSKQTDTINVSGDIFNNNVADPADPYKLLVTGINFTQSPIDRNVQFDITNMIKQGGTSQTSNLIDLPNGGIIANSQMGQYLITSSGSSNMLNASLLNLNPQMYRGQVATVASYANQLVVNNMLFDHMNILANDLIAQDKNANMYAAANPLFAPYQYSKKDGNLWYKAYGNFERISMTQGLNVGNNAYGSLIGADFPLINLKDGWKLVPTAYIGYNGGHQTFDGVSMYQNGAQLGAMGTVYKGDFISSLLAYGGGYANDMSVKGQFGSGSDTTGNWFAGVASKTAYNIHLPADLILQPTALVSYNIFGNQNYHSNFGNMSMNSGFLNGINVAPGVNLIWNKKTFSLYATAQLVFNIMGNVSGKAGNIDLNDVRMNTTYFEYGLGAMKKFKDRFTGYLQITLRNGYRTGIGFQGGLQWKIGK